jgi:Alpha amylase, catalytic domain
VIERLISASLQLPIPAVLCDVIFLAFAYVGTYMDSNGDGIGDFKGLMRRLDYLHGLGVTAIWLMPFQVSPHRDDGYDVSDHYGVDPRYGTIVDLSNSPTARSNAAYVCSSTS